MGNSEWLVGGSLQKLGALTTFWIRVRQDIMNEFLVAGGGAGSRE